MVWDAINPHTGAKRIDEAFPLELRESTRDHDMQIKFHNGSTWSCVGSDQAMSRLVGASAVGCVFSEFALSNPSAWAYIKPMLEENNGWVVFITTPRGKNHALDMFHHAQRTKGWFSELLTARDTEALTEQQLDEVKSEYRALYGTQGEQMFNQEYLCDWTAGLLGSFYAEECRDIRNDGRILEVEPIADEFVHRSWDIGVGDDTSIFFWQAQPSGQLLILDHLVASGHGVEWYRDEIFKRHSERGWKHGVDYVPHDAKVREFGTGRSRVETMASLGLKPQLAPHLSLDDGINAVRRTLPLCIFHPRTERGGFDALEQYRREWDDEGKCFKPTAVHDWTSHPADSFRYLSLSWRTAPRREIKPPKLEGWYIPPPQPPKRGGIVL